MIKNASLLEMKVYHKRHRPVGYSFSHNVVYFMLNLENKNLAKQRLFSLNKFNMFSLSWKDYGVEKFNEPLVYIKNILDRFKINHKHSDSFFLLSMPKVLGFGFNPVSFWLCFNEAEALYAVLAEVNNTFGERHSYMCFNQDNKPINTSTPINQLKVFHVSPFCPTSGHYEFRFEVDAAHIQINIDYFDNHQKLITTSIKGHRQELVDKSLMKYIFLVPAMTLKVLFLIHYHAIKLWLKKVPYIKKPKKSNIDIT